MNVFLSWSGEESGELAGAFYDWVQQLPFDITLFFSREDIESGDRWEKVLDAQLEALDHGILFITKDNLQAPWLFFEAGAIAKSVKAARVSVFTFGEVKFGELVGPLKKFQASKPEKDKVWKLLTEIQLASGKAIGTPQERAFERAWPDLLKDWLQIQSKYNKTGVKPEPKPDPIDEILNLCRRIDERIGPLDGSSNPISNKTPRRFHVVDPSAPEERRIYFLKSISNPLEAIHVIPSNSPSEAYNTARESLKGAGVGAWTLEDDRGKLVAKLSVAKDGLFSAAPP